MSWISNSSMCRKWNKVKFEISPKKCIQMNIRGVRNSELQFFQSGTRNKKLKSNLYSILDSSLPKYAPKGAAVSMSPCLLANSFCVDFYELYKQQIDEGDHIIQDILKRAENKDILENKRIEQLKEKIRKGRACHSWFRDSDEPT